MRAESMMRNVSENPTMQWPQELYTWPAQYWFLVKFKVTIPGQLCQKVIPEWTTDEKRHSLWKTPLFKVWPLPATGAMHAWELRHTECLAIVRTPEENPLGR